MKYIKNYILLACLLTATCIANAQTISFNNCPVDDLTLCEPDPRIQLPDNNKMFLGETNPEASSCSAHIRLQESVTSSCGIIVSFVVDYYPFDGAQRVRLQDTSEAFTNASDVAQLTLDTKLYGTPGILLNGISYNEDCPTDAGGFHRVVWTVMNECGDIDSCSYLVRLEDCVAPLAEGISASTIEFPLEQEITISAQDFIENAIDDCSPVNWLLYSWREDIFAPIKTLNCDSIAENGSPAFQFDIWVADAGVDRDCNGTISWAERAKSNLFVLVFIEDDCEGELFDGEILSENDIPVENVLVSLHGGPTILTAETNDLGRYRLPEIDTTVNYTVIPTKTTGVPEGISTLDLIKIQKHLLGIEQLSSPYKMIAADANNNSDISAVDLLELRKVILRVSSTLPNNTSWRFVPRNHVFSDTTNPWPFPSTSNIDNLDFVGVKVGDVNESITEPKTASKVFPFMIEDRTLRAGESVEVKVRSGNRSMINGLQGTIELENAGLADILPGELGIGMEDLVQHKAAYTFSWFEAWPIAVNTGNTLFTIVVRPEKDCMLSEILNLSSRLTESEVYVVENGIEPRDLTFEFAKHQGDLRLVLEGRNPIDAHTFVSLEAPEDGKAQISIIDFTGRVLGSASIEIANGRAVIPVSRLAGAAQPGAYVLAAEHNGRSASLVIMKASL